MQLFINNLPVAIPESTEFNYFSESRYFSDANGYSLDIDLPLEGCPENRRIFGFIEKNPPKNAVWPARLVCSGIDQTGSVLLLDVSKASVKVQFLSGRATSDYAGGLSKIYINEMEELPDRINVGNCQALERSDTMATYSRIMSAEYKQIFSNIQGPDNQNWMEIPAVALPWINDQEKSIQNYAGEGYVFSRWDAHHRYSFDDMWRVTGLSWMPFLLPLAKTIAQTAGYTADFSQWETSDLRNLIVCNAIPSGIFLKDSEGRPITSQKLYRCGKALPHWTILEFFDNISPLLNGEFTFDHLTRKVRFDFSSRAIRNRPIVCPEMVEDGYEITSDFGMEETDGKYLRSVPWRYDDPGMELWKFMDCPWYIPPKEHFIHSYANLDDTLAVMKYYIKDSTRNSLVYPKVYRTLDLQTWVCFYIQHIKPSVDSEYNYEILPLVLNLFGPESNEGDDAQYRTLSVLPAVILGEQVHLAPEGCEDPTAKCFTTDPQTGMDDENEEENIEYEDDLTSESFQTQPVIEVSAGDPDKSTGYYDHLFVGLWRGSNAGKLYAIPETAGVRYFWAETYLGNTKIETFSMRLNAGHAPYSSLPKIDESIKFTFYFHSSSFPDVNAIFNINGRRYLCRRLEATLTSRGMSRRLKGEFYPIVD